MPQPPDPAGPAVFLTEPHGSFENCDVSVDDALADHFGIDAAVDWIVVTLELFTESLTIRPLAPAPTCKAPVPTCELPGAQT
ncbi:MAG: hypothetical protein JO362_08605 [Streptomycetaceae bacterium]|nr:hypothetical protein [Streptomycetaceae bacterium]